MKQNIGKTRNRGVEVTLGSTNIRTKNFTWTSSLTFTKNKEEITELVTGGNDIGNGWFIGSPISVFYDYEKLGIWQTSEAIRRPNSRQPRNPAKSRLGIKTAMVRSMPSTTGLFWEIPGPNGAEVLITPSNSKDSI